MNPRATLVLIAAALLGANARAGDATIQVLESKLQQRDRVISELLDRVEALERRVGVAHVAREAANPPSSAARTGADVGATAAPGKVVVSEEDAERALERSLTRDGAVLLRPGVWEIEPSLRYVRREESTPTLLSDGGSVFGAVTERNSDNLIADLALRLGLPWDSQLEIGIPYQWRRVQSTTNVGFAPLASSSESADGTGDLRIGVAKTLLREGLWRPDLVGRITWDTGTGSDAADSVPLGGGSPSVRGSLSAIKRQDPVAFVAGLSYEHSLQRDRVQPGAILGASVGSYLALSPESSLRLVASAAYQQETRLDGRSIAGSDRVLGALTLGGTTLVAPGTLLNLSLGIGLTQESDDFSVMLSLPMRFN